MQIKAGAKVKLTRDITRQHPDDPNPAPGSIFQKVGEETFVGHVTHASEHGIFVKELDGNRRQSTKAEDVELLEPSPHGLTDFTIEVDGRSYDFRYHHTTSGRRYYECRESGNAVRGAFEGTYDGSVDATLHGDSASITYRVSRDPRRKLDGGMYAETKRDAHDRHHAHMEKVAQVLSERLKEIGLSVDSVEDITPELSVTHWNGENGPPCGADEAPLVVSDPDRVECPECQEHLS
jgi:hypothetical protein